ncbi:MAG TPA: hypothetical protein VHE30_01510 [Polyangiaceae bacterium]|nr:hypothetical protein [Polyangiaceae bacterium]
MSARRTKAKTARPKSPKKTRKPSGDDPTPWEFLTYNQAALLVDGLRDEGSTLVPPHPEAAAHAELVAKLKEYLSDGLEFAIDAANPLKTNLEDVLHAANRIRHGLIVLEELADTFKPSKVAAAGSAS